MSEEKQAAKTQKSKYVTRRQLAVSTQLATVLISLCTLIVIVVHAWIYNEQRKLMDDTRLLIVSQTNIMKHTLQMNRAYVSIASVSTDLENGELVLTVENVGKSPADQIHIEIIESRQTEESARVGTYLYDAGQQLIPGGKMAVRVKLANYDPLEAAKITSRTTILYANGSVKYDDGFGNTASTTFSFEYSPSPNEGWVARPAKPR